MSAIAKISGVQATVTETVINGDIANAHTDYTYFNMLSEDYMYATIDFTIEATTLTLEATNSDYGTADASAVWTDVTLAETGAATVTATGTWIIDTPFPFRRARIKRLTTNATNALTLRINRSR